MGGFLQIIVFWLRNFCFQLFYIATWPLRKLLTVPSKLTSGSRRLGSLSIPAQVAIVTAILLVVVLVVVVILFLSFTPFHADTSAKLNFQFWLLSCVLIVAIPLVLYKALLLWLEGPVSRYPQIDAAWKAGIAALGEKHLDIKQIPLYLVIGAASDEQEDATFRASGMEFLVNGATDERERALRWYANQKAIYIICSHASCLSAAARSEFDASAEEPAESRPAAVESAPGGRTIILGRGGAPPRTDPNEVAPPKTAAAAKPAVSAADGGTILAPRRGPVESGTILGQPGRSSGQAVRKKKSGEDPTRAAQGCFEHLCKLIRRARQPYAPINGVLVLLPFALVSSRERGIIDLLYRALQKDLELALATLMLRCPVLALVTGMDEEPGFMEFVRRLITEMGDTITHKRFGVSFPIDVQPTGQRLVSLLAKIRSRFESFIYNFYSNPDALKKSAGNRTMYRFLCRLRRTTTNLEVIFRGIYDLHPTTKVKDNTVGELVFFGGCYFGGTGATPERQAFVQGWLSKAVDDHEEDLEWTEAALRQDARYRVLGQAGLALDTVFLVGIAVAALLWRMYGS